jgi:hypothetical protein
MDVWAPPPRISNDCSRRGATPESTSCSALGADAESVDLAHDQRLCRESESGWSEPLKSWQTGASRSSDHLGGST